MKYSISIITPAAWLETADSLLAGLGWGAQSFLVPLSTDGTNPATHFGLRATIGADALAALDDALASVPELRAALETDMRDDSDRIGQFESLIKQLGLVRVEPLVDF